MNAKSLRILKLMIKDWIDVLLRSKGIKIFGMLDVFVAPGNYQACYYCEIMISPPIFT